MTTRKKKAGSKKEKGGSSTSEEKEKENEEGESDSEGEFGMGHKVLPTSTKTLHSFRVPTDAVSLFK